MVIEDIKSGLHSGAYHRFNIYKIMDCLTIGYYELLEDALWSLCVLEGMEELCERMMNELKYYYRCRSQQLA